MFAAVELAMFNVNVLSSPPLPIVIVCTSLPKPCDVVAVETLTGVAPFTSELAAHSWGKLALPSVPWNVTT